MTLLAMAASELATRNLQLGTRNSELIDERARALEIGRNAVGMSLMLAAPMLIVAMIVGLIVGVVQAMTQINEVTLSFVPKILAVFGALAIAGPWLLGTMLTYTVELFSSLPGMVR